MVGMINGGAQNPSIGGPIPPGGTTYPDDLPEYPEGGNTGIGQQGPGLKNSVSVEQLYQEFLTNNPHADPQAAFMAGVDVGMGQVDDFSKMPYDPSAQPEVGTEIDVFEGQFPSQQPGGEFGEQFPPAIGGELGPGFQSPGFVPGGLPGTGVDPNAGKRQRGPQVDMTEFGIEASPTGQRNVRGA